MTSRRATFFAMLCTLLPATALAHPGHGATDPADATHYFTEPLHAIVVAVGASVAALAAIAWQKGRRRARA